MTYQMIQSVAVTGNIYQQFISYLLHESDTILLGTQNRERRLDGVPVSPTLIKQYEELQMFTILDVKWCQVRAGLSLWQGSRRKWITAVGRFIAG